MAAAASPLDRYRNAELTLEEFAAAAARLLRRLDVRPDDGRIRPAPDARGIRYYQTVGVLDRPVRYDGRRAIYGFRHVLQLLAVKRLQQEGHPLHLIQQSLAGRPTAALEQALSAMLGGSGEALQRQDAQGQTPEAEALEVQMAPSPLIAARLAPGVTITIDPAIVSDPGALITRATALLAPMKRSQPNKEH